jgi:hypothetical protein
MLTRHQLISKIMTACKNSKIDAESNMLARVANRLAHHGAPYEGNLTEKEIEVIVKFV